MPAATASAGQTLMSLFIQYLLKQMEDALRPENPIELKAADLEVVRKLLADNSVTLASVQRGDFGEMAQAVAEQFPFPEEVDGHA